MPSGSNLHANLKEPEFYISEVAATTTRIVDSSFSRYLEYNYFNFSSELSVIFDAWVSYLTIPGKSTKVKESVLGFSTNKLIS